MKVIKTPPCPAKGNHSLRPSRELELPTYSVCIHCGAKFYLVHETIFNQFVIPKERNMEDDTSEI